MRNDSNNSITSFLQDMYSQEKILRAFQSSEDGALVLHEHLSTLYLVQDKPNLALKHYILAKCPVPEMRCESDAESGVTDKATFVPVEMNGGENVTLGEQKDCVPSSKLNDSESKEIENANICFTKTVESQCLNIVSMFINKATLFDWATESIIESAVETFMTVGLPRAGLQDLLVTLKVSSFPALGILLFGEKTANVWSYFDVEFCTEVCEYLLELKNSKSDTLDNLPNPSFEEVLSKVVKSMPKPVEELIPQIKLPLIQKNTPAEKIMTTSFVYACGHRLNSEQLHNLTNNEIFSNGKSSLPKQFLQILLQRYQNLDMSDSVHVSNGINNAFDYSNQVNDSNDTSSQIGYKNNEFLVSCPFCVLSYELGLKNLASKIMQTL